MSRCHRRRARRQRVDLAVTRGVPIDVPVLWVSGNLAGDPEVATELLDELVAEPALA